MSEKPEQVYETDGAIAYVATGVANLRYETKAYDTAIFGQLTPGDRIRGVPVKGADSREWIMIKDGQHAGNFVWAGNLRRANDRPRAARRQPAYTPQAITPDWRNDVDCSVVVFYFDTALKNQGAPEDQQEAMTSLKDWYLKRAQMVASQRDAAAAEKRAMLLTVRGGRNLQIMKEAFAECTKRAVREGLR